MRFEELTTTRKGAIGERIVKRFLVSRGLTIYQVDKQPHPIDFMVMNEKSEPYFVEVKTYPRRINKLDTGIDLADWYKYLQIGLKSVVWLFFVDEIEGCCYVSSLSDLHSNNIIEGGKIYFPLGSFRVLFWLDRKHLIEIKKVSNINEANYKGIRLFFK